MASWYGPGFYGRRTANGEIVRKGTLTATHRTLPFGTIVRVVNLKNGRSVKYESMKEVRFNTTALLILPTMQRVSWK